MNCEHILVMLIKGDLLLELLCWNERGGWLQVSRKSSRGNKYMDMKRRLLKNVEIISMLLKWMVAQCWNFFELTTLSKEFLWGIVVFMVSKLFEVNIFIMFTIVLACLDDAIMNQVRKVGWEKKIQTFL